MGDSYRERMYQFGKYLERQVAHVNRRKILFEKVRELIKHDHILAFTVNSLENAPEYFWTINASTSGKYHHGETLVEHVIKALHYAQDHIRMVGSYWDVESDSIFYSSVALHDLLRCGYPGREATDEDGKFRTDYLHPIYVAEYLSRLEYQMPAGGETVSHRPEDQKWFKKFQKATCSHMGPWSPLKELSPMQDNAYSIRLHVFLVDYVVSRRDVNIVVPELEQLKAN